MALKMMQSESRRVFVRRGMLAVSTLAARPWKCLGQAASNQADRFELSLHQYSLKPLFDTGRLDLLTFPRFVKEELGISNIEFATEFCGELLEDPQKADAMQQRSKQFGVRNRVLLCGDDAPLDAVSARERSRGLSEHLKWARIAERLGCEFIRVRASTEGDRQQQLDHATSGIGALCDKLSSSPVSVLVENIAGFSRDPDWLVELVQRIGPQRLGLIADFGNFEGDIYAGMKQLLPHTKSVCTKSWEFDEAGQETTIDYARMMKIIKDSKFRGCIAIEYLGPEPVAGVRQTAALVRRYR